MKQTKKIFSFLMAIMLAFCVLNPNAISAKAEYIPDSSSYSNGIYYMYSVEDLEWLSYYVNSGESFEGYEIRLMNDINFNGRSLTPIGNSSCSFEGFFNGNGYKINGINTYMPNDSFVGFFGNIGINGKVQDLTLGGKCKFSGYSMVGGIAGFNSGVINHCCFKGDVKGYFNCIGGLVGFNNFTGYVNDCRVSKFSNIYCGDCEASYIYGINIGSIESCETFYFFPW